MLPNHSQTAKQCRYPQDTPPLLRALWVPAWLCRYGGAWLLGLVLLLGACGGGGGGESAGGGGGGESAGGGGGIGHPIAGQYESSHGNPHVITNKAWTIYFGQSMTGPRAEYTIISADPSSQTLIVERTHTTGQSIASVPCPGDYRLDPTISVPSATNPVTCYLRLHWAFDGGKLYACVDHGDEYHALANVPKTIPTYTVKPIPMGQVRPTGCGSDGTKTWVVLTPL